MSDTNGGEGRGIGSGDPATDPTVGTGVQKPLKPGDPGYLGPQGHVDPGLGHPEGPGVN